MHFFDKTPSGDILNVTGRNMVTIDNNYPTNLTGFLECVFEILTGILLSAIITPYVLIAILINLVLIYNMMSKYIRTSTEMRRLD
jgi:amino acid transporter